MNARVPTLVRKSVSKQLVEFVQEEIRSGEYQPGDRLPSEPELLERWKVSPASLRDALKELETVGLITRKPRVGTVIRQFDPSLLFGRCAGLLDHRPDMRRDLAEMREILEDALVPLVIENGRASDWEGMERAVRAMTSSTSIQELIQADLEFHQCFYQATHNAIFAAMIPLLIEFFTGQQDHLSNRGLPQMRAKQARRHGLLLQALKDGKVARAQRFCGIARE